MADYESAIQLNRDLGSANTAWNTADVFKARSVLKSTLASLLAHSVGTSKVLFLHAAISKVDTADAHVRVIAFTNDQVVIVDGHGSPTALILARSALVGLAMHDAPNLLGSDPGSSNALRLSLDYGSAAAGHASITLGHGLQTPRNVTDLEAFLPELQADLLR
ncbi:hypothetical protein [Curtobacterium flaccumfaciens]|uniref:hypothetical protein n=1 Tax=Curtobacterium flaccumfaciens TaxID=2035 RepID=UPI00341286F3